MLYTLTCVSTISVCPQCSVTTLALVSLAVCSLLFRRVQYNCELINTRHLLIFRHVLPVLLIYVNLLAAFKGGKGRKGRKGREGREEGRERRGRRKREGKGRKENKWEERDEERVLSL